MKKLLVFLTIMLMGSVFTLNCITLPPATPEDFGKLDAVQNVKMNKDAIYDKIMIYIATKFKSPKKIMEYSDKGQGIITFNAIFLWNMPGNVTYNCNYKMTINIKDNKYKIAMIPINLTYGIQTINPNYVWKEPAPEYGKEFAKINQDLLIFITNKDSNNDF